MTPVAHLRPYEADHALSLTRSTKQVPFLASSTPINQFPNAVCAVEAQRRRGLQRRQCPFCDASSLKSQGRRGGIGAKAARIVLTPANLQSFAAEMRARKRETGEQEMH